MTSSFISKLTVATIGFTCKTFLSIGYCSSVKVYGLENLIEALENEDERGNGRGIITLSNHISTLDDPATWGVLPWRYYFNSRTTRWVLGASDMMFTNPVLSVFFRNGQVIETFRGKGVFQPAVDTAIEKLNGGAWIHLFGEGKVNQPNNPTLRFSELQAEAKKEVRLLRFKWGVGRILMEVQKPPIIIPMWITGFDQLMPEGRSSPYKFFPKRGVELTVTFGKPIDTSEIKTLLKTITADSRSQITTSLLQRDSYESLSTQPVFSTEDEGRSEEAAEAGWLGNAMTLASQKLKVAQREKDVHGQAHEEMAIENERIRSAVTALLQKEVEALGKQVVERRKHAHSQ
ncbi:acyltransferase-domain-containing protein [Abortiporus biennis]|nr:acyltransferase-domain-containing protein [Abortiporus biennis]